MNSRLSIPVNISILIDEEQQQQVQQDEVLLSKPLWDSLVGQLKREDNSVIELSRITISISSINNWNEKGKKRINSRNRCGKSLIVNAKLIRATSTIEKFSDQDATIYVSGALVTANVEVFGRYNTVSNNNSSNQSPPPLVIIETTVAIPLSSIVLIALNTSSFNYSINSQLNVVSNDEHSELLKLLKNRYEIIREGEILSIPSVANDVAPELSDGNHYWRVAVTEPVLQGEIQLGFTKFQVIPSNEMNILHTSNRSIIASETEAEDGSVETQMKLVLNEDFLANSVLLPLHQNSTFASTKHQEPFHSIPAVLSNPIIIKNSSVSGNSAASTSVIPVALHHRIASSLLVPPPELDEDDNVRIFMIPSDLSRFGLFSGDWVIVCGESNLDSNRRVARVFAREELSTHDTLRGAASSIFIHCTPAFLHNLSLAFPPSSLSSLNSLRIIPLQSIITPLLPTALSVTVARVASPYSINRVYQSLFLEGLKNYFQLKKRILKKGDLIAIEFSEEEVRFGEFKSIDLEEEKVDLPSAGLITNESTAVVFFQITSLEMNIVPIDETEGFTKNHSRSDLSSGLYGCYIDPKITKLVQAGLEKNLIPEVQGLTGIEGNCTVSLVISKEEARLFDFVTASLRSGAKEYDLPFTVLLQGARGSGKRTLVKRVASRTGFHFLELDCFDLLAETQVKTENQLRSRIEKAINCSPCILLLTNLHALARKSQILETGQESPIASILRECFTLAQENSEFSGFPSIVVATTSDAEKIPANVLAVFTEDIRIEAPTESERLQILQSLTLNDNVSPDVSLRALAIQTAALVASDLQDLVRRARSSATLRINSSDSKIDVKGALEAGLALVSTDFNQALEKARNSYSESIGAPKIPSVAWDDVGGLVNVKSDILDTIQLPLEHPELFADGLKKRSGILLYGPPGTGKTLLAKAVATSCSLNFFSIKGPELLNMYIGESEANVRRVFQRARDAKPCVIFFDELDSVAPKRGNQGDSGGVMDRIVSQLLAELDGMAAGQGGSDVFVIGATNRPDLLDPALLRPGRFDRMLYLGVSDTHDSQLKIIQALTRKFKLDSNTQLEKIALKCPFNYTGADFYALCSDAMLKAMTRKANEIDSKIVYLNTQSPYSTGIKLTPQYYLAELATPSEIEVLVSQVDFEAALLELVPSVSKAEMDHYALVQQRFSGESINGPSKTSILGSTLNKKGKERESLTP